MNVPNSKNYVLIQFTDQGLEIFWGGKTDQETRGLQEWLKANLIALRSLTDQDPLGKFGKEMLEENVYRRN